MRILLALVLIVSSGSIFSLDCENGCESVETITTKIKSTKVLEKIIVKFPMNVVIQQGDRNEYYVVGNVTSMKQLKAKVKGKALVFEEKKLHIGPPHIDNITAYVTVKGLTAFASQGRVSVQVNHLITDVFSMECQGRTMIHAHLNCNGFKGNFSGDTEAHLIGEAQTQEIMMTGEGVYNAAQLTAHETHLNMQGNAQAEIVAMKALYVDLSGNVVVTYSGNPQTIQKTVVGPALLKHSE